MPVGDDIGALTDWVELRISSVEKAGLALAQLDRLLKAEGSELADEELGDHDGLDDGLELELDEAIVWLRAWLNAGVGTREPPTDADVVPHWEDEQQDEPPPLGRPPLSSYNDAGVDVVVWWKFADGRRGFPVLLAQCTVQLAWE